MKIFFLLFLSAMLFAPSVLAVSISLTDYPKEIKPDTDFNVSFTVTGAKSATNYFRILLYKEGTHSYEGETWNNESWYGGSEGKQYLPISVTSSATSGECKGKISSKVESGQYLVSIKRYTASGNSASDDITPVQVQVVNSQTPLPASETPRPTSTPVPTPPTTITPSQTPAQVLLSSVVEEPYVLGQETTEPSEAMTTEVPLSTLASESSTSVKDPNQPSNPNIIAGALAGLTGLGLIGYGVYTLRYVRP